MKATLNIHLTYDGEEGRIPKPSEARENLLQAAGHLASEGMLSGADDVCLKTWSVQVTTSEDKGATTALEIRLWNAINEYAKSAGAENPVRDGSAKAMSDIEQVLADYRDTIGAMGVAIQVREDEIEELKIELANKRKDIRDLGKACYVLKNVGAENHSVLVMPMNLDDVAEMMLKKSTDK